MLLPIPVTALSTDGTLTLRAEPSALVVTRGSVTERLPLPWPVTGVALHQGRGLVVGEGPDAAHVLVVHFDGATPLITESVRVPGARLGVAWLGGDDAWVQLRGATAWEGSTGAEALPAATGDHLVHFELWGDSPPTWSRLPAAELAVVPGVSTAWIRGAAEDVRLARVRLPEDGAAMSDPLALVAPPRAGARLARAVDLGDTLLLAWEAEGRVELSVVGADSFGAISTREYLPAGEGRVLSLDVVGDGLLLRTVDGGQVFRTALAIGPDGHLRREGRVADPDADAPLVAAAAPPSAPQRTKVEARPSPTPTVAPPAFASTVPPIESTPVVAPPAPPPELPAAASTEPVRVATMPQSGLVLGELPDRACVATPRPPPSSAPELGGDVVVAGGRAWAIQPDTRRLWRVDAGQLRLLPFVADGLWMANQRVIVLFDGGRRLGLLDAEGESVARSVPIAGNVHAVVPTEDAIWIATETGDSSCGTELLRVPYDEGVVGVFGLAGAPGPMAARLGGVVIATLDPETERSTLIGVQAQGARTLAWLDGQALAVHADRDGADLVWQRGGLGFSRLAAHAGAWSEARSVRLPEVSGVRDAWVDEGAAVVRHTTDAGARVCRVDSTGLRECVAAPSDEDVWTARLGDDLLVGVGSSGLVPLDGDASALNVARTDHASIGLAACAEGGSRRACTKALRGVRGETILAVGQDGDVIATLSNVGIVMRDARSGRVTVRRSWGG